VSKSKRTFGLLAAVIIAGTLIFGFSIGAIVAKPKAAETAAPTATSAADLDRRWHNELDQGDVDTLVSYYDSWDELCRGYAMGAELTCEKREIVGDVLATKGMCYGKVGQSGYQMIWHACVANSCRPGVAC
jgi:hypothetical protein